MRPKEFFRHLLLSLVPHKYRRVIEKKLIHGIHLYAKLFVFGLVILFLILIPTMHDLSEDIVAQTGKLENATLAIDFHTTEPITILQRPGIYIDSQANGTQGAMIRVGEDTIYRRRIVFFGEVARPYHPVANVLENPKGFAKVFRWLIYLILPGFIMLLGLLTLKLSQLIAVASALLSRLLRKENSFRDYYMVSLHAQLVPLLVLWWSIPFINIWWVSLLLYLLIYVLAVVLLSGYKFKSFHLE